MAVRISPSERVRLIKQIALALSNEDWSFINLTLRQFGENWETGWNGDNVDYVVHMLNDAADDSLVAMAKHLEIEEPGLVIESLPTCWAEGDFRLFISHTSANKEFATALRDELKAYHICGFVAHVDIEPTKEWRGEIESALRTADALVALLTKDFHASDWTDQEMGMAMGCGLLLLPVRFGKDPYGLVGKYQALTGLGKTATELASELHRVLQKHDLTTNRLAEATVCAFEKCWSWEDARHDMTLLEGAKNLRPSLLDRIEYAANTVEKIRESYGVPQRVERLLTKHRTPIPLDGK